MDSPNYATIAITICFGACFGLFLAHSYREVGKFLSGWTATAFHTDVDPVLNYPVIVVCHKRGTI